MHKFAIPAAVLSGFVALAALPASLATAQSAPAANGATLFAQRCQVCHTVTPGARSTVGPNLAGVTGRKAAAAAGFNYSPALKASNVTWNRANLDRYLTAPARMVPGTRMVIAVTDARQRAAILDHLATRR